MWYNYNTEWICGDIYIMSGNHLLPIYYNTCRLTPKRRKKKKVSQKELKLRLEHEKFLKKMGVKKVTRKERELLNARWSSEKTDSEVERKKHISEYDWSPCTINNRPKLSGNYVIGQAYNKGGLVVVSAKDCKDESTGKRR